MNGSRDRTRALAPALLLLLLLGTGPASACLCRSPTLASTFERADWVVLATVSGLTRGGAGKPTLEVTTRERFKGEPPQRFTLPVEDSGCGIAPARGETWVFFLSFDRRARAPYPLRVISGCGRHFPTASDRHPVWSDAKVVVEALRQARMDPATPFRAPWRVQERPRGHCRLIQDVGSDVATGRLFFDSLPGQLRVSADFQLIVQERRRRRFSHLSLEIDGATHRIPSRGLWAGTPSAFSAPDEAFAVELLEALTSTVADTLDVSLDGDFTSTLDMYGFAGAARDFARCRERRPAVVD